MKTSDSRAFVNQLVVCLLVGLGFGGSVGLGTVWMRHQISLTADTNRALAAQLAVVERQITECTALVDVEQSPSALRQRNQNWNLGLVAVTDPQVIHINQDVSQRLAESAARNRFNDGPGNESFRVALGQ